MIPYGKQDITADDIEAVEAVLTSDFLTQGPVVPKFEQAVAERCGAHFGVAVNSATSALHIACLALGLGPGDWLWTSPNTFVASANCGRYCGANIDFVDIDPLTYNLCVKSLAIKLKKADKEGRLPKILLPVHFAGEPCDMAEIAALGKRYGFRVIEDASHALGACYEGQPVGNCLYSDITVFSFHPVKIITTGEGGLATTNDPGLAQRLRSLRSHGITREPVQMRNPPHGSWYYEQVELGYNYRMSDIQSALGLSQLQRLDNYISRRHILAEQYDQHLAGLPVVKPHRNPRNYSSLHLYTIQVHRTMSRDKIFKRLHSAGIGVNVHYIPVHTQPDYQKLGFCIGQFPVAESYYKFAITLPLYPGMSNEQQSHVINELSAAINYL